ncbi:MAG: type I methionyl aminopeptidase [candidate division KSB1 bacterium]|nr:type I methionyl aminopeptidase [candidate division KSB1 bacterium]MDZ7334646.1 type I methionyl aminopeptidase [candidate division KSB1 bacterium]MDZ7357209.1 type I methionyl aminopeptidase [candidate division KSB1 bacterium]MDZ7399461.1 type I methionyl aminopeptidase [candidate division KSB1 bacterium]
MIIIKSPREIELIRNSCRIVVDTFHYIEQFIRPEITTLEIDRLVEQYIRSRGARPAFKGYRGFPASVCISIDAEVVHGVPKQRKLKPGQIVSIDIGVEYQNYFGDGAKTFVIGEVPEKTQRLLRVTREALYKGIEVAQSGRRLSDISHTIQSHVEQAGFSVVRDLVGHGVGRKLHEDPQIPNYGPPNRGPRLKPGMTLAIEPMVNMGGYEVEFDEHDKWTVRTVDGLPSAHFEHTIAITENGADVLTDGLL